MTASSDLKAAFDPAAIEIRYIRASGPGGQNVNKVSSAVELRFDLERAGVFDEPFLSRLATLAGRRLNKAGVIVIHASRFRTQEQNERDARARLDEMLEAASVAPRVRRPTRATAASKRARLEDKRQRGITKATRRGVGPDD